MESDPLNELTDDQLADLARLADGTLPAERREEVEAAIAASPQLSALSQRQDRALLALRGTDDTGAPARLRAQVERAHDKGRSRDVRRFRIGGTVAAVAAAAALALVLVLPGAVSGGPSVATAAALAEKPPTGPAPGMTATPQLLDESVDDVPFPNYAAKFGWNPAGSARTTPRAATRRRSSTRRTASGSATRSSRATPSIRPTDARTVTIDGVDLRLFEQDGRNVVTWERDGHTCVLSGEHVSPYELLVLAAWRGKGSIPF